MIPTLPCGGFRCLLFASFCRQDMKASTHCRGWDFAFLYKDVREEVVAFL